MSPRFGGDDAFLDLVTQPVRGGLDPDQLGVIAVLYEHRDDAVGGPGRGVLDRQMHAAATADERRAEPELTRSPDHRLLRVERARLLLAARVSKRGEDRHPRRRGGERRIRGDLLARARSLDEELLGLLTTFPATAGAGRARVPAAGAEPLRAAVVVAGKTERSSGPIAGVHRSRLCSLHGVLSYRSISSRTSRTSEGVRRPRWRRSSRWCRAGRS